MRGKIDLSAYRAERGIEAETEHRQVEDFGVASDPYQQAREEASEWLHANFQDILADPREHEVQVFRDIGCGAYGPLSVVLGISDVMFGLGRTVARPYKS